MTRTEAQQAADDILGERAELLLQTVFGVNEYEVAVWRYMTDDERRAERETEQSIRSCSIRVMQKLVTGKSWEDAIARLSKTETARAA